MERRERKSIRMRDEEEERDNIVSNQSIINKIKQIKSYHIVSYPILSYLF